MTTKQTPPQGQRIAYAGLAFGAGLSVLGNIAHTVLTPSTVSLGQRVPFAIIWPAALFIAVEVLVRVRWRPRFLDRLGRVLLIGPVSAVSAIVSYLHLHHLMTASGETLAAAIIGPVAVDGLMLGSTVALLAIRSHSLADPEPPAEDPAAAVKIYDTFNRAVNFDIDPVVFGSGSAGSGVIVTKVERKQKAAPDALKEAVLDMLDGATAEQAAEKRGVGKSTAGRYARAIRLVRSGAADVDWAKERIRLEMLEVIGQHVASERKTVEVG